MYMQLIKKTVNCASYPVLLLRNRASIYRTFYSTVAHHSVVMMSKLIIINNYYRPNSKWQNYFNATGAAVSEEQRETNFLLQMLIIRVYNMSDQILKSPK